jgi:hypothetical protein
MTSPMLNRQATVHGNTNGFTTEPNDCITLIGLNSVSRLTAMAAITRTDKFGRVFQTLFPGTAI